MDRASAIAKLPGDYALLILLRDIGAPDDAIADRLAIDVDDLPTMLRIAQAKLSALRGQDAPRTPRRMHEQSR